VLAFSQQPKTNILIGEQRELEADFGQFEVKDKSKYHVRFTNSNDGMFFRWPVFYPACLDFISDSASP